MSTIQIVGIAVAAVVVLLLVIALIVTRKGGGKEADEEAAVTETGSFFDSAPSDTLAKLGHAEHVPEPAAPDSAEAAPPDAGDAETTGEIPVVAVAEDAEPSAEEPAETEAAAPAAEDPAADEPAEAEVVPVAEEPPEAEVLAAPEATAGAPEETSDSLVPLSSIIVTTSTKIVDLKDPEIRRMLTDLVTYEIDQATQFREAGQSLDAVLQLTEAEKICRALGKEDTAREIGDMMRGLQD
jgi:hypothetical protein